MDFNNISVIDLVSFKMAEKFAHIHLLLVYHEELKSYNFGDGIIIGTKGISRGANAC